MPSSVILNVVDGAGWAEAGSEPRGGQQVSDAEDGEDRDAGPGGQHTQEPQRRAHQADREAEAAGL